MEVTPRKHKDRAHAPLSPSAAKRWLNCPASYRDSIGLTSTVSEAAREGIIAHEWIERLCESGTYDKDLAVLENRDSEMAYHVNSYIDFLDELKQNFQNDKYNEYEEYVETRVTFTDNIWGTLDYGCARRKVKGKWQAIVSDFKYGRGTYVPNVSTDPNPQLILYLLGLEKHLGVEFEKAWLYIYQPRIPRDEPFEMLMLVQDQIAEWRVKILKAENVCLLMARGELPPVYSVGDHCQFCLAQPTCQVFHEKMREGALKILDPVLPEIERVSIATLVELHKRKKQIEHFLENVDHYLLGRGLRQQDIGDLKIVEGRATRRWLEDEEAVASGLRELGVQPWKKKLITIGEVEKEIGKGKIENLTNKPPGKLQLVSPDDTRQPAQLGRDSLALLKEEDSDTATTIK